jgi:biopolymer transport protein ExbB
MVEIPWILKKSGFSGYALFVLSIVTLAVFIEKLFALSSYLRKLRKGELDKELKNSELSDEMFEEEILSSLERGIGFIRLSASVAPLLGLLGTVMGMITAFQKVAEEGYSVNPAQLADGIWTALLTTAEGFCIAIPSYLAYHFLEFLLGKVDFEFRKRLEILKVVKRDEGKENQKRFCS